MAAPSNSTQAADGYPPFTVAVTALVALMVACLFSFLDRQILNLLVQPIKQDLGLSDTQIGVLQGIAFAVTFSVMALPFGWMADRFHRIGLIAFGMTIWSLATIGSGFSDSFTDLLIARMLVGVGEATLMPAAYSLLADYFPPHQRGRALSTFLCAFFLGNGGGLVVGGLVLHALAGVDQVFLPLIGALPVWKTVFIIVGAPGLLVAALLLFIREPGRRGYPSAASAAAGGLTAFVRRHPLAFFAVLSAYSLLGLVSYSLNPWAPTLLIRNYGLAPASAGVSAGMVTLLAGIAGGLASGFLGDRWMMQGRRGGRLALTFVFWFGALPFLALFVLAGDVRLALAGYAVYGFSNAVGYVSSSHVLQDMVPGHLRGRVTGFWYLVTGVIANGFGPVIAGVLNDDVFRSEAALPYSLLAIATPCIILGLLVTLAGLKAYDRSCADSKLANG